MSVIIGSARIDENGKATGGRAGDQTGKEVSTQAWYLSSKGWVVLRAKDENVANKIAYCMQRACDNPQIGYDQNERNTLYNEVKKVDFDAGRTTKAVETDCSALVRVCLAYAGIMVPDFYTGNEVEVILATKQFTKLTDAQSKTDRYLKKGDILVTKKKGHTAVVVSTDSATTNVLKKGDKGDAVTKMQELLINAGYSCGKYGADGDFGSATEKALKAFQKANGLDVDGIYGPKSKATLESYKPAEKKSKTVSATTYSNIRAGAGKNYNVVVTVPKGEVLTVGDGTAKADGWDWIEVTTSKGIHGWIAKHLTK